MFATNEVSQIFPPFVNGDLERFTLHATPISLVPNLDRAPRISWLTVDTKSWGGPRQIFPWISTLINNLPFPEVLERITLDITLLSITEQTHEQTPLVPDRTFFQPFIRSTFKFFDDGKLKTVEIRAGTAAYTRGRPTLAYENFEFTADSRV